MATDSGETERGAFDRQDHLTLTQLIKTIKLNGD